MCYGYTKEPSRWDGSFEHLKHRFKLMAKKMIIYTKKVAKSGSLLSKCLFQIVRHGGCLGLGLAAMGTARQGEL